MSKQTAEIICRALLAIVAALRKEHNLPDYHGVTIHLEDSAATAAIYDELDKIKP